MITRVHIEEMLERKRRRFNRLVEQGVHLDHPYDAASRATSAASLQGAIDVLEELLYDEQLRRENE